MAGDYPSTDFTISEQDEVPRVVHLPTGMEIATIRLRRDRMAVPSAYMIEAEGSGSHHPTEVAQAALRHLPSGRCADTGKGAATRSAVEPFGSVPPPRYPVNVWCGITKLPSARPIWIGSRGWFSAIPDFPGLRFPFFERWCIAAAAAQPWMLSAHPLL